MKVQESKEYSRYIRIDQPIKISFTLTDDDHLELNSKVRLVDGDRLTLELVEEFLFNEFELEAGIDVFVSTWTDSYLCLGNGVLSEKIFGQMVFLQLTSPLTIKSMREYFRLDVSIPITY